MRFIPRKVYLYRRDMHTDQRYVVGFQSGDTTLINKLCAELYLDNREKIVHMVMDNSGCRQDGEDIFQRALLAVYSKAKSDETFVLKVKISTYFYKVALNLWRKVLRERKKLPELTILGDEVLNNEQYLIDEIIEHDKKAGQSILFHKKFKLLSENCQAILSAFFEGKSLHEVAETTGKQSNSIRTLKSKCLKGLRELIQADANFEMLKDKS